MGSEKCYSFFRENVSNEDNCFNLFSRVSPDDTLLLDIHKSCDNISKLTIGDMKKFCEMRGLEGEGQKQPPLPSSPEMVRIEMSQEPQKAVLIGSSTCGWTVKQIETLKNEFPGGIPTNVEVVECDMEEDPRCAQVDAYPTWVLPDGSVEAGYKPLSQLDFLS